MAENTRISNYQINSKNARFDEKPSLLNIAAFVMLWVILMFTTIAYGAVDFWAIGLLCIFTCLLIIFWFSDALVKKVFEFKFNLLQVPLLVLILIGLIQLLPLRSGDLNGNLSVSAISSLSHDFSATRFAVINLINYFLFFAAAYALINNEKRLKKTVFMITIFGAIMAFFGILQRFSNLEAIYGMRDVGQATPFGSFVNQHHFAAFMEMTIGITLGLIFGKVTKTDKNPLLIIATVIMGIALLLTSSRGGYVSLLGVIAFIVLANLFVKRRVSDKDEKAGISSNSRRNMAIIASGIAVIIGLFAAMLLLGGDESLLRGTGLQYNEADLSNGRFHFWQIAVNVFLNNPIIGAGLNSFGMVFSQYDTWNGNFRVEQAHNDYLQILADAGILGFACILSFIFLLFKRSLHIIRKQTTGFRRNAAIGALAGCFGILVHSFFDFPLRTPSNMFFFLTLVVIASGRIKSQKNRNRRVKRSQPDDLID